MPNIKDIMKTAAGWAKNNAYRFDPNINRRTVSWQETKDALREFGKSDLGKEVATGLTAAAPAITGGNHLMVGDGLMGLGAVAGAVNPFLGLAVTAGGALMNAAFGSNVNQGAIKGYEDRLVDYSRPEITAQDNTQLLNQINGLKSFGTVKRSDLGTQGWFNHDVDYAYNNLVQGVNTANASRARLVDDAVTNVEKQNDARIAMNYKAFGGPIFGYMGDGAIAYDMARDNLMVKMMKAQEGVSKDTFDKGGPLFTDFDMGVSFINAGGTHEKNPFGGVFMGKSPDGKDNVVEEGESIYKDYVFSNRLPVPKAIRNKYKMRGTTFSDVFKEYFKKNGLEERENDDIAQRGLMAFASELMMSQEMVKARRQNKPDTNMFPEGGTILHDRSKTKDNYFNDLYAEGSDYMNAINWYNDPAHIKERDALISAINAGDFDTDVEKINGFTVTPDNWYALATDYKKGPVHNAILNRMGAIKKMDMMTPIGIPDAVNPLLGYGPWGSTAPQGLVGVPTTDNNKDDEGNGALNVTSPYSKLGNRYRMAGLLANAGALTYNLMDPYRPAVLDEISDFTPIGGTPIGNYVPEFHTDTRYAANQQAQQAAATRAAILDSISPMRYANLLAADYNAQTAQGQLLRDAAIADYDNLLKAATYNRETNKFNSQLDLDVAKANMSGRQANENAKMQQEQFNISQKDAFKRGRDAAIGQGVSNIIEWLNANARERDNLAMLGALRDSGALASNDAMDLLYNYLAGVKPAKTKSKSKKSKNNGED